MAHRLISRAYRDEDWWVFQALRDGDRKWFVLAALGWTVPRRFFAALIRAAVAEPDRSKIRLYIAPCAHSFGLRQVAERLLPYLDRGTAAEKAGAAVALCCASIYGPYDWDWHCSRHVLNASLESLGPSLEERAQYAAWRPLREVRNRLLVAEFLAEEDGVVRGSIVALLFSDPEVPDALCAALGTEPLGLVDNIFTCWRAQRLSEMSDQAPHQAE
jgi:hypothetical protein